MKYQKEGGPSLEQSFALLREVSSTPVIDLSRLLDAVIFNYLVGNNDAHGKNFSLLYRGIATDDMQVSLAPLYDIVSTVYYPEISRTMAMKLGGEYSSEKVTPATSSSLQRKRDSPNRWCGVASQKSLKRYSPRFQPWNI